MNESNSDPASSSQAFNKRRMVAGLLGALLGLVVALAIGLAGFSLFILDREPDLRAKVFWAACLMFAGIAVPKGRSVGLSVYDAKVGK